MKKTPPPPPRLERCEICGESIVNSYTHRHREADPMETFADGIKELDRHLSRDAICKALNASLKKGHRTP